MFSENVQVKPITLSGEMTYRGETVLRYKIEYPRFWSLDFIKATRRMNLFYQSRAKAWERHYRQTLYKLAAEQYRDAIRNNFPVRIFEAVAEYKITYNQDCAVSLYTDKYEYTGGAHGNTLRYSETWNLETGRRMRLSDFFSPILDTKEYAETYITKKIEAGLREGDFYFENYGENVKNTFRPEQFFLTPIGIIFYFQQYDIAPYSSGIPQFLLPFSYGVVLQPECD